MNKWLAGVVRVLFPVSLLVTGWSASAANTITLTNQGSSVGNYPVQIGRAFQQSELPSGQLPQATITGVGAVSTQVDVKNRWPDNSLKYVIISFLVPNFTANQSYTVTFAAGTTVGNTALTATQMLASGYNFDAQIQLTKSSTMKYASARTMLAASPSIPDCSTINWGASGSSSINACYWTQGPIATTVIIANHAQSGSCGSKAASAYDFGFDSYCPFRPVFEATFWATTSQVRVRYVGEITDTEQLENVAIDSMALTLGNSSPSTVYTKSSFTMTAGSRWTKTYWLNGAPPNASINHNLAYLASTMAVPNYDTTKSIPSSVITTAYNTNWLGASSQCSSGAPPGTDIYQVGEFNANGVCGDMSQGGGHDWVGSMPSWTARWLYSGDYRMAAESLGNADLLGAWGIHFREGNSTKYVDRARTAPSLGHVVSISSRPLLSFAGGTAPYIGGNSNNGSAFVAVGAFSNGGFYVDPAHMPETYIEYLLTGDHYYLEENLFWTGWSTWWYIYTPLPYASRGPTNAEGGIGDQNGQIYQLRGQGWAFLSRVQTAFITPDAMADQGYLNQLVNDAIANWEGQRNITTGYGYTNDRAEWNWGYNAAFTAMPATNRFWTTMSSDPSGIAWLGVPPLHWWDLGNFGQCDGNLANLPSVNGCYKNWMYSYLAYSLGRASELGYNSTALLNWAAVNFFGQVNSGLINSTYDPYLTGAYFTPITKTGPAYYSSWADTLSAYLSSLQTETSFAPADRAEGVPGQQYSGNGYAQPFAAATSYMVNQAGGGIVWSWLNAKVEPSVAASNCSSTAICDTKWAILPRSINQGSVSPPTATNLVLVSGNNQTATAGQPLSNAFTVEVTDSTGNPVSGTAVTFSVTSGGGSLNATVVSSNSQGLASSTLTLGPNAGTNAVVATSGTLAGSPITFVATGTAPPPGGQTNLIWTKQPITAGAPNPNDWFVIPYDPVSGQTIVYATAGAGIYSSDLFFYRSGTNTWTEGPGTRSMGDSCPPDTPTQPGDRHPIGQMAVDTKRNFLWLYSGSNSACGQATVTTNGTAVTWASGGYNRWVFPIGGQLNNQTVYINGSYYTIASVQDPSHLTLTTSAGVLSAPVRFQVMTGTESSPRRDLYFLRLNVNPTQDTWQQVMTNTFPKANYFSSMVYDPDDDVLFAFGYDYGPNTNDDWVFCRTAENPVPGALTAKQSAAGCTAPDDWSQVSVVGGVQPSGTSFPGLAYDPVTKKVIQFGGQSSVFLNQTWAYDVPTRTWKQKALSTTAPPVDSTVIWGVPAMAYNSATGKILYHQTGGAGAPADWQYDPVADTWTQLVSTGGGATSAGCSACPQVLAYDATQNVLVGYSRAASGGPEVWVGTFSAGQQSQQAGPCDLNADGVVNAADVQLAVSQTLGTRACGNASLEGNGICTVVDVQRVVNASLGRTCRVGP